MVRALRTKVFWTSLLILLFCISIGVSQESPIAGLDDSVEVNIQFHDRRIYYVGDPVWVEFQISNLGFVPYLFRTSYDELFTFDLDIATTTNKKQDHSIGYVVDRNRYAPILTDEITLKPHEVYGARINITRWFDLKAPGDYVIRGRFYPNLITDPDPTISSANELYLTLYPERDETGKEKRRTDEIQRLKAESLPPYKVVDFLLNALMKGEFDKYFLYINFDQFISQFDNTKRKYMSAKDFDKPPVIEEFKAYLRGENKIEKIPFAETIPVDYAISRTVIEGKTAEVVVIEKFKYFSLYERKRYTYYLREYGDKWLLERYTVVNIGS